MRVYNIHMANEDGRKYDVNVLASSAESAMALARSYEGSRKPKGEYGFEPTTVYTLMEIQAIEA